MAVAREINCFGQEGGGELGASVGQMMTAWASNDSSKEDVTKKRGVAGSEFDGLEP